jgi:exopolyphosphatase / guanosine-5'-triphosphate,3'-diphosphate pyrophosphatase
LAAAVLRLRHDGSVKVGVIDVGSNTVRLLVAEPSGTGVRRVREERALLSLGAEIERRGKLPSRKIDETATEVARFGRLARSAGAVEVSVLITSPGRQAKNGEEFAARIAKSAGATVRLLSAQDEGRMAYAGALAQAGPLDGVVAVCDVGGGSSQISIGTDPIWPTWIRSVDVGSLRLTQRFMTTDPPRLDERRSAAAEARAVIGSLVPPRPHTAFATGGTARAVSKIAGRVLDGEALERALYEVGETPIKVIVRRYGIPDWRARLLTAGTLLLRESHLLLGVPLEVARGGLREGAALELLQRAAAVA